MVVVVTDGGGERRPRTQRSERDRDRGRVQVGVRGCLAWSGGKSIVTEELSRYAVQ